MTKTTESKWRSLIAEQERSGMTVRAFAQSRGITPTTLYWWRSRLGRRRHATGLVAVKVVDDDEVVGPRSPRASCFELHVDDTMKVRIPVDFDEAELRRLVRALRC